MDVFSYIFNLSGNFLLHFDIFGFLKQRVLNVLESVLEKCTDTVE